LGHLDCRPLSALLVVFIASPFLPPIATMPSRSWMTQIVAEATRVYGSGGFADVLAFRIRELPGLLPLHFFMFPRSVALMLIGAAIWRAGLFQTGSRASRHLPMAAAIGLSERRSQQFTPSACFTWDSRGSCRSSAWHRSAGVWSWRRYHWASDKAMARSLLAWAAPLGRMAFTNYVMQSMVFGWLFYGYGLGLFAKVGVATALAIAPVSMLAVFSAHWLLYYRFGLEWLWRSAMYGAWQPLRRG
jgi:uncharacterized protein